MFAKIKKVLIAVCVGLMVLFPMNASAAQLPEDVLKIYSLADILFYNPYDCSEAGTGFCTTPSGDQITWIGDSDSVMAGESLLNETFPGLDYGPSFNDGSSYIMSCKFIDYSGGCDLDNPSGLEILKNIIDKGELRPYLVFALGGNGYWDQSMMNKFLELVGDDTQVVIPTVEYYDSKHGNGLDYSESNQIVKKAAEEHSNIYVADVAANYKDEYFDPDVTGIEFNAEGSKMWIQTIKDALPQNCTAGLLPGNNIAEKIWNYFVQANIEGISDNAAAIAGIMGNFYTESGLNPFMHGYKNDYYRGLYMLNGDSGGYTLRDTINSAVGADYWSFDNYGWWCSVSDYPDGSSCADNVLASNNVPQDAIDTALKIELDFLVLGEINGEQASQQGFHSQFEDFVNNFDAITNKSDPRSYAELFVVLAEIAYGTSDVPGNPLQDSGVSSLAVSKKGYSTWQGATKRGDTATEFYDRYANMSVSTTSTYTGSMTSGTSNITAASSGGYIKYDDLTDSQITDLAEVAFAESGDSDQDAFRNYLAIMANVYEKNSDSQSGPGLVEYVKNSEKNMFSKTEYINEKSDVDGIPNGYIDAARDVLMNGNRNLPQQIVFFDKVNNITEAIKTEDSTDVLGQYESWENGGTKLKNSSGQEYVFYGWISNSENSRVAMGYAEGDPPTDAAGAVSENANVCEEEDDGSGGVAIAQAAVRMAWPVQEGQGDDTHAGQCEESNGEWVTYTTAEQPCKTNPRELYYEQLVAQGRRTDGMDCGVYVGTVLQYVGAIENVTSTYDMQSDYFRPSDDWEEIENNGVESMKPGDVLVASGSELGHSTGHIFIYVGDYGGSYGNIAEASLDTRTAQVGNIYNETVWHIWRYKAGGEESDQVVGPVHDSSEDIECDPRTNDLGVRDDAYYNGQRYSIRLCSVPNIPDRDGSADGHDDGYIHVNSRVSGAFYAMAEEHKNRCGTELVASEGFRTAAEQQYFWDLYQSGSGNLAAAPGYSNHQGGLAVDFDTSTYCSNDSSVVSGGWFNEDFLAQFGLQDGRSFGENWHVEAMEQ